MFTAKSARWQRWITTRIPAATQYRLHTRNLFIFPSRAGFGAILITFLILVAGINFQSSLTQGVAYTLIALGLVSMLHSYLNLAGLQLSLSTSPRAFAGEPLRFIVHLENVAQSVQLIWPQAQTQVDVTGSTNAVLSVPTSQRGPCAPGRIKVVSTYPLGLYQVWSWLDLQAQGLVYPNPIDGPLRSEEHEDSDQGTVRNEGDGLVDLRAYHDGDRPRQVLWRAYARSGELWVQQGESQAHSTIMLDLASVDGDIEHRLSVLTHWVLQLHREQRPFALRLPGYDMPEGCDDAHRERCLDALGSYQ